MFIFGYKEIFFLLLITIFSFSVKAQQTHFVYLQTDNGQPFYVKLNSKVLSSSSEGYIILPGITDGDYKIAVGFPKREHPEENFTFNIDNKNEGFLIKNFDENGLQLFNLETLALINGTNDSNNTIAATVQKDADPFSTMLAKVVKDSSILQNHQIEVPKPVIPADTATAANNIASASLSNADSFSVAETDSPISQLLSKQDSNGLRMVYADKNNEKVDIINVFIPSEKEQTEINQDSGSVFIPLEKEQAGINQDSAVIENKNANISSFTDSVQFTITPTVINPANDTTGFVSRKDTIAEDKDSAITNPVQVFIIGPSKDKDSVITEPEQNEVKKHNAEISEIKISDPEQENKDEKAPESQIVLLPKVVTSSEVNSDCKAFASNEDFLKLRKKMAAESTSEDMIKVAKKYFKSKCFSTEQIKDLSYLFLNDEGRYMFFDAAYAYTSDSDQYQILESQLTDEYYLNRFKAMIRK